MHRLGNGKWEMGNGRLNSCVNIVYRLSGTVGKAVGNLGSLPQVVFATVSMGTNYRIVRNLGDQLTQTCAHVFLTINRVVLQVFPFIHRANNNYDKGDY